MQNYIRLVAIAGIAGSLCACFPNEQQAGGHYQAYGWRGQVIYPENYEGYPGDYRYGDVQQEKKQVIVPETYHVGSYHSPARAKDRDRNWVQSQNPGGYTIELATGSKASQVAGKLHKAPKSNRRAQVKYQQNGQAYYKGVYGSYSSYQAAQQALNNLPDDVRQGAQIKSWGSVQGDVNPY